MKGSRPPSAMAPSTVWAFGDWLCDKSEDTE
eukprot:CAMPEP_0115539384 /NCGR_PEP_ID=MMETSP0271-20121206/89380_1 /TAXON_ID=71861 /ORGANISM="Scrippsiella trochoidea, Strain CCMP3099" /LENGTH=30 /DNA_ID= /DNA_START= /DNA_END= /DNA_ORIENTATION=